MNIEKIRDDFPALQQKLNGKPIIYFDNACMTLRPRQVIEVMNEYYEKYPGCAGRSIHKIGNIVTEKYNEAREIIAKFIGAKTNEVIFTRNTTEGLNLIANSLDLKKGDIVITSDREHNSNLIPWQILSEKGIKHVIIKSNNDMTFDIEGFEETMNKDVKLVSIVHTSNLDGYTLPVKEIIKISHDYNAFVMLDGAQSVPHKEINVKKLDCDFLAFSGHKMLGPSGIGVLYGKYDLLEKLKPFIVGGETVEKTTYEKHIFLKPPEKFEGGLQNYAGAMGLAAAAKYIEKIGRENIERHETELNKIITYGFKDMPIDIIGPKNPELRGGIISFNIKNLDYHDVAIMLDDMENIMVRSGQHCVHSWFNANNIKGSVRVSLYLYNTKEECNIFLDCIRKISTLV
ncbi:MAG: aminotransferase class V-fold PLP-dependent enzyme [Candidatus Aenigmatarchaeota archaeon]